MKEGLQKVIGGVVTLSIAYFVFTGLGQGNAVSSGDEIGNLNAEKMYAELGGVPGKVPVVLFVTSWCGVCRALERDLSNRGIEYVRADVEENRTAMLYYRTITQSGSSVVPVTTVGTKLFLGFKPQQIVEAIEGYSAALPAESI